MLVRLMANSSWRLVLLFPVLALLGGCKTVVLSPSGDVALQQRDLLIASTVLMLLVVVPVMILTVLIAWRYRASNQSADYDPEWSHSLSLEVAIWTVPLLIIIAIGALTWLGTHLLDPYRPLQRISADDRRAALTEPLQVEVVALDWKWLFFYPQYGIASLNELSAPVDRPISFKLTSTSVMNSFYVPALAGQIYTMPGMETKLHAVINKAGTYQGFSANYSGAGFSKMEFKFRGLSAGDFDAWISKVKGTNSPLDRPTYALLAKPSEGDPVKYYSSVAPGLYSAILNMCVTPGKMCMSEMMAIDAKGGGGKESQGNREKLTYDRDRTGATGGATPEHSSGPPAGAGSGDDRSKSGEGAAPPPHHH